MSCREFFSLIFQRPIHELNKKAIRLGLFVSSSQYFSLNVASLMPVKSATSDEISLCGSSRKYLIEFAFHHSHFVCASAY